MLDKKGMEKLSAWIFSAEQVNNVEELPERSESFRRTCVRCFSETTISTFGAWVLPKICDVSKGIF